jgi:uncharacterized protein (DUF1919 family)
LLSKKLLKGLYPKIKNKIKNNLEKNITNFFDCKKKIVNNCINIINDNMYNGLIKEYKILDK